MRIQQLESDLYILTGEQFHSNSTVIVNDDEVLLVDAMASVGDAEELRAFVTRELGKRVRFIICTHYFSDHLAALRLFPESQIIAHQNYSHTFDMERFRTEEEKTHFVEPDITISDGMRLRWGTYMLDVFHNPGHTMSTINIDIASADLLLVGDNIVGNMIYLYYSTPHLAQTALERLHRRGRGRVIEGHNGLMDGSTVANALHYLNRLEANVKGARRRSERDEAIQEISLDQCLPESVEGTDFERIYHQRNLQTIIERTLFATAG